MSNSHDWWRNAVIYQIYPKSFADANGDGTGDVNGIRSRLPYLAALGIDAVWLSPFYPGPQCDGGYDVSDYRDVDPMFGSLADMEAMITEAHALDIKVIVDIVPNHTSVDHRYFVEAMESPDGSPAWNRYHRLPGRGDDGELPPNNWKSIFGGNAWTEIRRADGSATGDWYLHLFDSGQPDVNWNHPDIHREFEDTLRFWFDRGVDGFRIDVAHGLIKADGYPDIPEPGDPDDQKLLDTATQPFFDQPGVHAIYRTWRAIADEYDPPRIFVAEAWVPTPERRSAYLRPDELHTGFNFDFLTCEWSAPAFRTVITDSLAQDALVGAPTTWVAENHDVRRAPTRYAGKFTHRELPTPSELAVGRDRARAVALLMLSLPGSVYVYQGQELALEEVIDLDDAERQDPSFFRTKGSSLGRDGCRVPLPWSQAGANLGFSPVSAAASWLTQPAHWAGLSAESQTGDADSMLELMRRAIGLRRGLPHLASTHFEWRTDATGSRDHLVFSRGAVDDRTFVCFVNFSDTVAALPSGAEVLVASAPVADGTIRANSAAWYLV